MNSTCYVNCKKKTAKIENKKKKRKKEELTSIIIRKRNCLLFLFIDNFFLFFFCIMITRKLGVSLSFFLAICIYEYCLYKVNIYSLLIKYTYVNIL